MVQWTVNDLIILASFLWQSHLLKYSETYLVDDMTNDTDYVQHNEYSRYLAYTGDPFLHDIFHAHVYN